MISVLSYLSHLLSLTCVIRTIVADEAAVGGEVVEPEVEGILAVGTVNFDVGDKVREPEVEGVLNDGVVDFAVGEEVVEPEVEGVVAGEAVGIVAGGPVMNKGD